MMTKQADLSGLIDKDVSAGESATPRVDKFIHHHIALLLSFLSELFSLDYLTCGLSLNLDVAWSNHSLSQVSIPRHRGLLVDIHKMR